MDYILLPEIGSKIDYEYDVYGNLQWIKDNAGNTINYTYDSEGNRLTEKIKDTAGALQKDLSYAYDALNRLKQIQNPDGSYAEYGYDARANRTSSRSANGYSTKYEYDALYRMVKQNQPGGFTRSSTQLITTYDYDKHDNLTRVTDPNGNATTDPNDYSTTYKYDDKGRVYQVISPDTGTTTYSYDAAGNMVSKKDAKNTTISYEYDLLNRLTKINFPIDSDIIYVYDSYTDSGEVCENGKGRLCFMKNASETIKYLYSYTAKGQVKLEKRTIDGTSYTTRYSYDQNGNVKTMTYPSGKEITYNYSYDLASGKVIGVLLNSTGTYRVRSFVLTFQGLLGTLCPRLKIA